MNERAHHLALLALLALVAASCTRERTQIMLRIGTDMSQGPSGELGAFRLRVSSGGGTDPDHDEVYPLGADVRLPTTLALVPASQRDGIVEIEIEARAPSGAVLFTQRASAHYVPERTLLLDVVLAGRCLSPTARDCPNEQSCGLRGCEPILRVDLPDYLDGIDASLPPRVDAGLDACASVCDEECVDTASDLRHCGTCGNACSAPAGATPTCVERECGFDCGEGTHACGEECVSSSSLETCGTSCTPCPETENGVALCDGRACSFVCDPGYRRTPSGCVPGPNVDPPRPVAPLSFGRVTSTRPTFRWVRSAGSDGALVQVCRDRACADVIAVREVGDGATSARLLEDLPLPAAGSRRLYFRLFGRTGDATGASPSPTWSFVLPARGAPTDTSFGGVYDFNGDGLSDLAVGSDGDRVELYSGASSGLVRLATPLTQAVGAELGVAIASAGDVDGDGYGDVVIGAPGIRRAYIYRGSAGGVSTTPITLVGAAGSDFGRSVAGVGDVNGDGYADVLVGAPGASQAMIFFGGATVDTLADVTLSGAAGFGAAVSSAGDVDADGLGDLAIGAPGEGRVYVFRGAATLPSVLPSTAAASTLSGSPLEEFGAAIAGALDVDGDGYGDLLVGAPGAASGEPAVGLYLGGSAGLATAEARSWSFPGPGSGVSRFGAALHAAGDVNRDGYDDWVAGAPGLATAYVFRGRSPSGEDMPAATYSTSLSSRFGAAVTSTGDVDGDGYDDTVIGAPGAQSVTLYLHTAAGLAASGASITASVAGFGRALACWAPEPAAATEEPT